MRLRGPGFAPVLFHSYVCLHREVRTVLGGIPLFAPALLSLYDRRVPRAYSTRSAAGRPVFSGPLSRSGTSISLALELVSFAGLGEGDERLTNSP